MILSAFAAKNLSFMINHYGSGKMVEEMLHLTCEKCGMTWGEHSHQDFQGFFADIDEIEDDEDAEDVELKCPTAEEFQPSLDLWEEE